MPVEKPPTQIMLVSGSLRSESVNTAVLRTICSLAPGDGLLQVYGGLGDLPHFNPDDDREGEPLASAVGELRKQLAAADGVLFCTPEYAGALPGSFKNFLDWTVGGGETYRKPVAWINASSRPDPEAAAGAHQSLRAVLGYTGATIVEEACVRVVVPRSSLVRGLVVDEALRDQLLRALVALIEHCAGEAGVD
jgi:chromate reductase